MIGPRPFCNSLERKRTLPHQRTPMSRSFSPFHSPAKTAKKTPQTNGAQQPEKVQLRDKVNFNPGMYQSLVVKSQSRETTIFRDERKNIYI